MLAFHSDISIKEKYLDRVRSHRIADEIIKGIYWENGKGCAVGCTLHGEVHSKYEIELGIPEILAKLEDVIFEKLPNNRAKLWPEEFLESIKIGSDLSSIWPKFAKWILIDEKYGVLKYVKLEKNRDLIKLIANYYDRYKETTKSQWDDVVSAAYAAVSAAAADAADADAAADAAAYASAAAASYSASVSAYAASAAADAYAAYAAYASAAYAAVSAAADAYAASVSASAVSAAADAYAAYAAASADAYAAYAAAAASSYSASVSAVYANSYEKIILVQADKLIELLKECE